MRGEAHTGLYPLSDDDTCWWTAADFDKEAAMLDALAYMKAARSHGIPAALEVSQSGRGAHVWIFFAHAVAASVARTVATSLLGEAFRLRGSMHLSYPAEGLLPPALAERFRRRGQLHDQTALAIPDGSEVVVLVEGLRLVVDGVNDDEPAAANFRCGDGFA